MAATPDSSRVPAWKKLGLKLKYASDESPAAASPSASKKRAREDDAGGKSESKDRSSGTPSKKSKKRRAEPAEESTPPSDEPSKKEKKEKKREKKSKSRAALPDRTAPDSAVSDSEDRTPALSTPVKTLQRKKSVSFTPDTKKSDGDSGQQLFKAWVKSQDGSSTEDSIVPSTESAVDEGDAAAASELRPEPSKKDLKKAKKEQRNAAKAAEAAQQKEHLPPYVTYLQQYHSDRSSWKFNKKHQVELLKNLFNLFRVPASYDPAVEAYISGLNGAAARYRLKEHSELVLKETSDVSMEDPANRKAAAELTAKRRRAEKVVKALGHVDEPPAMPSKTIQPQKEVEAPEDSNKKRSRPRKSRTMDIDSSSSEDDSSSDESSAVSSSSEEPSSDDSDSDSDSDSVSDDSSSASDSDDPDSEREESKGRGKSTKDDSSDSSDSDSDSD
ncbi:putative proteasome subunit alpha type 6 [Diplodia seriata]|uniref:Putative proteasome subunit alpha type 6 n=1 Tax=Diplodia seriata TaxID=420778 RepID=A0A0G2DRV6_9PEZI|nr:putative proteasome subunit alpha type 6 [Diplodia seriata]OMP82878.1 hypothetical protein BK809_0001069 [Diplodia seriata]